MEGRRRTVPSKLTCLSGAAYFREEVTWHFKFCPFGEFSTRTFGISPPHAGRRSKQMTLAVVDIIYLLKIYVS